MIQSDFESFRMSLPIPVKVLSPNCTIGTIGGRFIKASAIKRHRKLACEAVEDSEIETVPWEHVSVSITIYYATRRRRDEDNVMGSLKSYYDGIVDSGLVADDDKINMTRYMPRLSFDDKHPRVEIILMRLPGGIQCSTF